MRWSLLATAALMTTGMALATADEETVKPTPPPPGATILFDGKSLEGWVMRNGQPPAWKVLDDGSMECVPGKGDIRTQAKFGPDFRLHVEFWLPLMKDAKGQGRANSGVYLQGRYEIQVLDSYMNDTYEKGVCGALYNIIAPSKIASKPPEQWQTYDITLNAPRVDDAGKVAKQGVLTVVHNGETIIDKGEFGIVTGGALDEKLGEPGPILFQDHGNKVRFRNVWLVPSSK